MKTGAFNPLQSFFAFCLWAVFLFWTGLSHTEDPPPKEEKTPAWNVSFPKAGGTGFFIQENILLVNFHTVIDDLLEESFMEESFMEETVLSKTVLPKEKQKAQKDASVPRPKKILALSADYDLALIETTGGSATPPLTIRTDLTSEESLSVQGWPGGVFKKASSVGRVFFEGFFPYFFITPHVGQGGMSGAPVLDNKGRLVGVISRGSENKLYMLKANFIQESLKALEREPYQEEEILTEDQAREKLSKAVSSSPSFQEYMTKKRIKDSIRNQAVLNCRHFESPSACAKQALTNLKIAGHLLGLPQKQHYLAEMYNKGIGFAKDPIMSFDLFQQAAEQAYPHAQFHLAIMYHTGEGVEKNWETALYWYEKAAQNGYIEAQQYLNKITRESPNFSKENSGEKCLSAVSATVTVK